MCLLVLGSPIMSMRNREAPGTSAGLKGPSHLVHTQKHTDTERERK